MPKLDGLVTGVYRLLWPGLCAGNMRWHSEISTGEESQGPAGLRVYRKTLQLTDASRSVFLAEGWHSARAPACLCREDSVRFPDGRLAGPVH